jgi:hypothetical protein
MSGTANISPLTQAIVAAAAGGNLTDAYNNPIPSTLTAIADNIPSSISNFKKSLAPLILKYRV